MRILVLNQYAVPTSEGGLTRHIDLFERLPEAWEFHILAGNRNSQSRRTVRSDDSRFTFIRVPAYDERNGLQRMFGWVVYSVAAVLHGLRRPRPDVVFASSPHLLTPLAGLVLARLRRARFVLEVRDIWPESLVEFGYLERGSLVHAVLERLERFLYRRADHVIVVSEGWRPYFQERGVLDDRLTVVTNGAETSEWAPRGEVASLAERLGVEGPVVVYAGAHGVPNGLDYVLNAAAQLRDVTFAFIGDGVLKTKHVARASAEGLTNVRFVDPVPKSELGTFLWTADIGVHTLADIDLFKIGMSPNKLYDYMAAGLPVISNAGGLAEEILAGSGAGVPVGADDVATGVRQILSLSPQDRAAMGRRGTAWIEANASRGAMAGRLQGALERLAPARHGSAKAHRVVHVTSVHQARDPRISEKQCRTLAEAGYDVTLVATGTPPEEAPFRVVTYPRSARRLERMTLGSARAVARAIRLRPAVIHMHDPELVPWTPLLRLLGVRVIFDSHEDIAATMRHKPYVGRAAGTLLTLFTRVLVSFVDRTASGIVSATPTISARFHNPHSAVVQNFPRLGDWVLAERQGSSTDRLVYIGGITEGRGIWQMLDAVGLLAQDHRFTFTLAGPVDEQLLARMQAHDAWRHCEHLGLLDRAGVADLLSRSTMGLVLFLPEPNHVNSQPTKLFEYMAAGLPVVASDFPLWRQIVVDLDAGVTADPEVPAAIAAAAARLLADPEGARRMGENGRALVSQTLNWDAEAAALLAFYEELLASTR